MPIIQVTDEQLETLKAGLDYYYERIAENYNATEEENAADIAEVESAYTAILNPLET